MEDAFRGLSRQDSVRANQMFMCFQDYLRRQDQGWMMPSTGIIQFIGEYCDERYDFAYGRYQRREKDQRLPLLYGHEALGGGLESAIPRAIAVEFIQAATLIHDDFVDQDTLRRNRPAVWTVEGARRAVLIGMSSCHGHKNDESS